MPTTDSDRLHNIYDAVREIEGVRPEWTIRVWVQKQVQDTHPRAPLGQPVLTEWWGIEVTPHDSPLAEPILCGKEWDSARLCQWVRQNLPVAVAEYLNREQRRTLAAARASADPRVQHALALLGLGAVQTKVRDGILADLTPTAGGPTSGTVAPAPVSSDGAGDSTAEKP